MKVLCFIFFIIPSMFINGESNEIEKEDFFNNLDENRFNNRLNELKEKISGNSKYNQEIAFFIDMKIKSAKHRFFIYDLKNDKVIDFGMVAHGSGSETEVKGELKFSNEPNSKSTSLGNYAIGRHYKGMFGKAYKLHGLDTSNSNAFKRNIVLHHYSAVPYEEQEYYISNSQGCPMVNEVFFKKIEKIIDNSKSSILLDIYY